MPRKAQKTKSVVMEEPSVNGSEEQLPPEPPRVELPGMSKDAFLASFAPPEPKKLKKVAVLGFTNSWRLAPFDDPEWEIWGLNELYMYIPRWTRWFEIHRRDIYTLDKKRLNDHVERLKKMTVPIYMQERFEDIPESVEYPLKEVIARFGDATRPYLTNTISYMIALAMLEGFEEIGVFGVDMAHDTEYGTQRPSCEYYIGMARGMGIKVTIPPESDLLKAVYLYGYQDVEEAAFRAKLNARRNELGAKAREVEMQIQNLTAGLHQYRGAMQDVEHILKIWSPNSNLTVGNNEAVDAAISEAVAALAAVENEKEKELAKAAQS